MAQEIKEIFLNSGPHTAATTNRNTEGTKVCRYSWHSAGPGLAISSAKTFEYIFQIKYIRKQFYQTVLGNCYGLKLPKCRWQFKNAFIVSFIIIISAHFRSLCAGRSQLEIYIG